MRNCEHFQAQVFDHLFGLLDAEEGLELIEHAGRCEACRAALVQADGQRKLIAAAAKAEFPQVHFAAPAPLSANPPNRAKRRLALPMPRHPARWAAAAVVLVALGGLGMWVVGQTAEYHSLHDEVALQEQQLDRLAKAERQLINQREQTAAKASADRDAAQQTIKRLADQQQEELDRAAEAVLKRQVYLVITGHETLRAGVPNEYRIEIQNLNGERERAELDIQLRDLATRKVIFNQANVRTDGSYNLSLPPDLPQRASDQVALEVVARTANGPQGTLHEQLKLARSSYVTQLVTDKPMYQPGETVRFRSLTLDRFSLRPATEDFQLVYTIRNPQGAEVLKVAHSPRLVHGGKEVLGPDGKPVRGIGVGEYAIPSDLAEGGEFVLTVEDLGKRFPVERRKFLVQTYQKHQLNKELKFDRSSYGPGDAVVAHCTVARAEGGQPLAFLPVTVAVRVDGTYYQRDGRPAANYAQASFSLQTDAGGAVRVPFRLPAKIDKGDASVTVEFTDGAVSEPLVRPVPVVVKKLQIEFFPEGGDLVAGVPNRVYFQARTPLGKPAEIKGAIVDQRGQAVAQVQTLHDDREPGINQGMGVFELTPKPGGTYRLQVESPAGIEGKFVLPDAVAEGIALSVPSGVTTDQQPIGVVLHSAGKDRRLYVGAYCRGALLDFQPVDARTGEATPVSLKPSGGVGGVYRITVFEKDAEQLRPLAERLVYRAPAARLNLAIRADQKEYLPGGKVKLRLACNAEDGRSAPAVVLVSVVDKSVLKMADERTARGLPTHFLLTSEVRNAEELEFADVLLGDHAQAPAALDLLLGTQGWRRFIESDPERFKQQYRNAQEDLRCRADVDRLRVVSGKLSLGAEEDKKVFTSYEVRQERILEKYKPLFEQAEAQRNNAEVALDQMRDPREFEEQKHQIHQEAASARVAYLAAFTRLEGYDASVKALQRRALAALGGALLAVVIASIAAGAWRVLSRPLTLSIGTAAAVGVCAVLVLGTVILEVPAPEQSPVAAVTVRDEPFPVDGGDDALGDDGPMLRGPNAAAALEAGDGRDKRKAAKAEKAGAAPKAANAPFGGGGGEQQKEARAEDRPAAPRIARPDPQTAVPRQAQFKKDQIDEQAGSKASPAPGQAKRGADGTKQNLRKASPPGNERRRAANLDRVPREDKQRASAGGMAQVQQQTRPDQMNQTNGRFPNVQMGQIRATDAQRKLTEELQKNAAGKGEGKLKQLLLFQNALTNAREKARPAGALVPCVVREYAYQRGGKDSSIRADFTETLFWHPALVLLDGRAEVQFDLCDSETTFQVMVAGHTLDGRLGATTAEVLCRKPFSLSAVVPAEVTANDIIDLPVAVANKGDEARRVRVALQLGNLTVGSSSMVRQEVTVAPRGRDRMLFRLRPTVREGTATITIHGTSEPFGADTVRYEIKIVPEGFPASDAQSDVLEGVAQHEITLPAEWVKDTLKCKLQVFPSSLADLQQGLDGLLREPHGCFEQTSTSNYPNVMILSYLHETGLGNQQPRAAQDARELLERGYRKLIAFECRKPNGTERQGYEWFGGTAPPHEALTAYGLLQFRDMARVGFPVDHNMVERTRQYLLARRDGKGGFQRNPRALDRFGRAPEPITNAYIVWALTESDPNRQEALGKEIDALLKHARDANDPLSKDPYFLALVANSLLNRAGDATELLKKLAQTQKPEGYLDGAQTSITGSGGRDLQIEATALGVLAWLKANRPEFQANVRPAAKWIGQQRGGSGAFGSTQATILALKALIGYARVNRRPMEAGRVSLNINGKIVAERDFGADLKEALVLEVPNPEDTLKPGANQVQITVTGKNVLPYTLNCSYNTLTPSNPAAPPVKLAASLDRTKVRDGETVRLNVRVENASGRGQGMAVAVIGLPAGLSLPANLEQLRNLAKPRNDGAEPGVISAFEVRNRELVLYWRDLAPKQKIELDLDLVCRVPGEYRGPAGRAYLYYNADHKYWIAPVIVAVAPKGE